LNLQNARCNSKDCIWSFAVCGSETGTVGKNEERVVNAFETWSWRGMLKIKRTDRITNGGVFQRVKEERLHLKMLNNMGHFMDRAYSWG
jgi:hypothetical protein